jgi:hypothetical protein
VRTIFRSLRLRRLLASAFLPYVAATLIFDALHLHAFTSNHGPNCPHHIAQVPAPVGTKTGYECPACTWQRNLPQQSARTWSPDLVRSSLPVFVAGPVSWLTRDDAQPALFRGPPAFIA